MVKKEEDKRLDPKEYMRMAVDTMKLSISERNKKDPSPHVGAVLVFPDGSVETAYRGEFREGDHAEYTVLDKQAAETSMNSLSNSALQKFLTESDNDFDLNSEEFLQDLKEMELLEFDEERNIYLPTGNAILLFGKNPRNKFPQASIKAKVHYGDGEFGTETFKDALVLIPDKVDDWLRKVIPASIDRSKFKAQQIPSFPIEVIREAIICHCSSRLHVGWRKDSTGCLSG